MIDEHDHLAAGMMRALSRSFMKHFSIRPGRAFGLSLVTFGLWPTLKLSRQFTDYVTFEKQQLWHLAEWLRLRRGGDDALALHDQIRRTCPGGFVRALTMLFMALTIAGTLTALNGSVSLKHVIDQTWQFRRPWFGGAQPEGAWKAWGVGLSAVYVLHAIRVMRHHATMGRFVDRLNRLLQRENVPPIVMPELEYGLSTGWWAAGIGLAWLGGIWGIPMIVAAAIHRQYISSTAIAVRTEMLASVREMLQQNRPAVAVPNYVIHGLRCSNALCRSGLRVGSSFCSRCGQSTGQTMSEVA